MSGDTEMRLYSYPLHTQGPLASIKLDNKQYYIMKKIVLLICLCSIFQSSYSQELESLGVGIINFLLSNPKTASRTNATEAAALNVIGNLLNTSANRKHDMNIANAGKNEVIINTGTENSAKIYSDSEGNIYLLYNERIYPIADGLVKQAADRIVSEIENRTLPHYDYSILQHDWENIKTIVLNREKIFLKKKERVTLCDLAQKYKVPIQDILLAWYNPKEDSIILASKELPAIAKVYACEKCLIGRKNGTAHFQGDRMLGGLGLVALLPKLGYKDEILTTFSFNWVKDLNGNGIELDDFQGIKRSFHQDENKTFAMRYSSNNDGVWSFEIYEALSGKSVYTETGEIQRGIQNVLVKLKEDFIDKGIYLFAFTLTIDNQNKIVKSDKFEVVRCEKKD